MAQRGDEGFHTGMVHLYRGEMQRMTVWRSRLDTTSNWAILLTTGMTSLTLGEPSIPHYVLLLGLALMGICVLIEARRYRSLLASRWRIELMEWGYFSGLLHPHPASVDTAWRDLLMADLNRPCQRCTLFMAVRLRLRRNYILLVFFISAVWLTKVLIHPTLATGLRDYYGRLAIEGSIPSAVVAVTGTILVLSASALAALTPSEEALIERERLGLDASLRAPDA